jgi:CBS domain-containing protein
MSRDVQYCRPGDTLASAARLMWEHDCGCVPVCSDDGAPQVIGMITDRDICMSALFQGRSLDTLQVADAMSREVQSCRPNDQAADVEKVMRSQQIRRVPVTDTNGRLVGILSLADLAREASRADGAGAITEDEIGTTLGAICEPSQTAQHAA